MLFCEACSELRGLGLRQFFFVQSAHDVGSWMDVGPCARDQGTRAKKTAVVPALADVRL